MGIPETVHDPARGGDAPGRPVEVLGRVRLIAYGAVHVLLAALIVRVLVGGRGVPADQGGAVTIVASLGLSGRILLHRRLRPPGLTPPGRSDGEMVRAGCPVDPDRC